MEGVEFPNVRIVEISTVLLNHRIRETEELPIGLDSLMRTEQLQDTTCHKYISG